MADEENTAQPDGHPGARAILTVEQRITHIVGMMERFEWVRGKSGPFLAAEWGVSLSVVEKASAEASRRCTADAEEVRRDISLGGLRLLREAVADGDRSGFKQVAEILAVVSGAKAAEKHQIVSADATPAEAARLVREAFGEKALPKTNGLNGHAKPNGHGAPPAVPPKPADD